MKIAKQNKPSNFSPSSRFFYGFFPILPPGSKISKNKVLPPPPPKKKNYHLSAGVTQH